VERYLEVDVEAVTPMGDPVRFRAHGWQARILQHEVDHLKVNRVRHPRGARKGSGTGPVICGLQRQQKCSVEDASWPLGDARARLDG